MPLIAQWVRQRPWLAAGIAGAAGGISEALRAPALGRRRSGQAEML